jgi:heme/copper-type cytochrome/quinol oxidase subunit 2
MKMDHHWDVFSVPWQKERASEQREMNHFTIIHHLLAILIFITLFAVCWSFSRNKVENALQEV